MGSSATLGTLGPRPVGAVAGGVTAASSRRWGMSIGAVLVGGGCRLGRPGEHGVALGGELSAC